MPMALNKTSMRPDAAAASATWRAMACSSSASRNAAVRRSSLRRDFSGYRPHLGEHAAGQEDGRAVAGHGAGDRAADRPSPP